MSAAMTGLSQSIIANDHPPPIQVRYFYASQLALDDPLAPVPMPSSTSASTRFPPRPLSEHDSVAVDSVWRELRTSLKKYYQDLEKQVKQRAKESTPQSSPNLRPRHGSRPNGTPQDRPASKRSSQVLDETIKDPSPRDVPPSPRRATMSSAEGRHVAYADHMDSSQISRPASLVESNFDIGGSSQGTTGTPFVRAPTRSKAAGSRRGGRESSGTSTPESRRPSTTRQRSMTADSAKALDVPRSAPTARVPVGASRLHQVTLPNFQLEPIYWSPVNDVADIIRATWFYKDTMLPVETDVANLLEAGYVKMRPWTRTWTDELNSAARAGSAGEEKIMHLLWPKLPEKKSNSRPTTSASLGAKEAGDTPEVQTTRALSATSDAIDSSTAHGTHDHKAAGKNVYGKDGTPKVYRKAAVIYVNSRDAHLLRANMQPSAYYGRKPYADYIRKGRNIGVPVVRGFSHADWERIHPRKDVGATRTASTGSPAPPAALGGDLQQGLDVSTNRTTPHVTDLILVMHGIGQKLSERVESYNFTYLMNSFRREFNVQLHSNVVKPHLRPGMGGTMILPVNWRSTLSFEEGGYRDDEPGDAAENQYTLQDITPDSLHNVRNIVSDVMLDIPYYLSHHQPRMIQAVIGEANRIYALWCTNNPGFDKWGRVHIIAHSLGSVMAIDILSKQPTRITAPVDHTLTAGSHFAFNTSNLFLCGSPAGFFLLLQRARLRPRAAHERLQATANDTDYRVGDEVGVYGCIAVENIYNILNPYDPVSYRLNAAVDAAYAASLKLAMIPSASTSWFAFGASARAGYHRTTPSSQHHGAEVSTRLPSNVELETHNFSREEIAEKRAYLLNDNGQIDFYLRYGGGPLEIQYLTMLGAHSSYWTSRDFIRFLAVETGREMGREGALAGLRVAKKKGPMSSS